jgi:hypothetical protein
MRTGEVAHDRLDNLSNKVDNTAVDGNTLVLSSSVWDDLAVAPASSKDGGGTAINWSAFKTDCKLPRFTAAGEGGQVLHFTAQMPHGYTDANNIFVHVHFVTETAMTAGNKVVWLVGYTIAPINGAYPSVASVKPEYTAGSTAANTHYITNDVELVGTGFGKSTMIVGYLLRSSDTTFAGNVQLLSIDFHIPKNRIGSVTRSTG